MGAKPHGSGTLFDAGVLWLLGHGRQRPVVEAACDLLAADTGGDAMARLAGHRFDDDSDTMQLEVDLRAAVRELGLELPGRETIELQLQAVRAMCRRLVRGEMSERELARWAHRTVGHTGHDLAQPLVDADDSYDLIEDGFYSHITAHDLDREVRRVAVGLARAGL